MLKKKYTKYIILLDINDIPYHRLTVLILDEIGLKKIRQKCPRFNSWLNRIDEKLGL